MSKRCLILGAAGQLGRKLSEEFRQQHDVVETFHQPQAPHQFRVDLGDAASVTQALERWQPDWILIAGAFCNVDLCETQQELCYRVNVEGSRTVAKFARRHGSTAVYYSTDHVFDGSRSEYMESDLPHPLNVYAQSKVQGEQVLQELIPDQHLIFRTAWLYGPDLSRRNFILRLIDRLKAGEQVPVPQDQWGSPTYTEDLAKTTLFLLEKGMYGLFHATGPDFINRLSLARQVCTEFHLDERRVVATPTPGLGQVAKRPLRVSLNCKKLAQTAQGAFRGIREGLAALRCQQTTLQGS